MHMGGLTQSISYTFLIAAPTRFQIAATNKYMCVCVCVCVCVFAQTLFLIYGRHNLGRKEGGEGGGTS